MLHYQLREDGNEDSNCCGHWCATALLASVGFVNASIDEVFAHREQGQHAKHGDKFPMPRIKERDIDNCNQQVSEKCLLQNTSHTSKQKR